jgi:hypothetical protein
MERIDGLIGKNAKKPTPMKSPISDVNKKH